MATQYNPAFRRGKGWSCKALLEKTYFLLTSGGVIGDFDGLRIPAPDAWCRMRRARGSPWLLRVMGEVEDVAGVCSSCIQFSC